ncbi:NAD(P)-dependent oxidoreductase [Azospirillum rugosum]|uniref:3-hydroxyisobutyrate dehydrogenase-like beta-hydroxyacid dehydrogenase n=1 Tax=Azospirillum rugosum TaxID=416170 RepID=A0ABS4SKV5_9PROT|nr:NAD(P)-dependent oxidoreductase [Azospirillum rugosum]MBP2293112.1 3-hydroxyisobutyrate dehydrogenase-like beta-hydroxyacid dehydrogenase [Azospirillum rugosum]MDQ0526661.1 3-hydroxyisobutyrate dehydrogenase-like beta-hydroxyacid dehydrogenase [Azospirillum rugosum]
MSVDLKDRTVGVIGLGLMGRPMARNLAKAGASLVVHSRSPGPVEELAAEGMSPAASPAEVTARADTVVLMLSDTVAVEAVAAGLMEALRPGHLVIDMGTTAVEPTRRLAEAVRAKGAEWVDAPVSGGTVAAEAGSLTIMAGGSAEAFAKALPLFQVMGQRITHVGDSGAGQVAKMANQVIVALSIGAVAEALALAKAAGVEPAKVRDAIRGGFAESRILDLHGQRMVTGDFTPGGRVVTQIKDLKQAEELAEQSGIQLPALGLSLELFEMLADQGDGGLDHAALYRLFVK